MLLKYQHNHEILAREPSTLLRLKTCSVFAKIKAVKERPNSDNASAFQCDRPRCIVVKTYWYHNATR